MTNADVRAFLDRFVHAWESQDVPALAACYADDCVVVSPIFNTLHGPRRRGEVVRRSVQGVGIRKVRVDDTVIGSEEPTRAVVVWNVQSTHVGEVFGMPGTGKTIERTVAYFLTIEDGKIFQGASPLRLHQHADAARRAPRQPGHLA